MRKRMRFLLIFVTIFMIISITGCGVDKVDNISIEDEPNTLEEKPINNEEVKENIVLSEPNWKSYLSKTKYNRNLLDIETPNEYDIHIKFDPIQKKYVASQSVKYINNEDIPLNELYFHIYPNAFKEETTTPYSLDSYIGDFNTGSLDILKITVEDKKIEYSTSGGDNTTLKIPMEVALNPGESVKIYMEYEVLLPNVEERFGYGDNTFQIGNGYPIAAVYDANGWNIDPYYPIGDAFYSDVSNYSVIIEAPKEYILAFSGKILSEETLGKNKIWNVEGKLMRDFAWAASEKFIIQEEVVDGILVKNYLLPNDELVNMETSRLAYKSVEIYNKIFGMYPYEVLSVVTVDTGGMEYPGMVFVWQNQNLGNDSFLSTITHEIPHQWWYAVVGNNQIEESWLDESFAVYAEKLLIDEAHGESQGEIIYNGLVTSYDKKIGKIDKEELILTPTHMFEDNDEYVGILLKGAMFLHEMEKDLGKEQFYNILKTYYNKYKFSIATTKDFIEVCEELTGKSYEEEMNKWFFDK